MIVKHEELLSLQPNGRDCEACGRHMHKHKWANLDDEGFVTECNFSVYEREGLSVPTQRSEDTIQAMLKKVDDLLVQERFEDDHELQVIQHVLLWVTDNYSPDSYIEDFFPEED